MILILLWVLFYGIVVAASIMLLGSPKIILGNLSLKAFLSLFLDWKFMLGAGLAVVARFVFIIINNLASKHPTLSGAHLSVTALATSASIVIVVFANQVILGEQLRPVQLVGASLLVLSVVLIFK